MGIPSLYLERQHPLEPHLYLSHTHTQTMKWLFALATLAVLASSAMGYQTEEEGEARLGFINVGSDGTTSLTFNATSIQNAVLLLLGLIGALIVPLFLGAAETAEDTGYGYAAPDTDTRSQPPDTDTPRGPSSTSPPSLPIWPPHKRSTVTTNKSTGTPPRSNNQISFKSKKKPIRIMIFKFQNWTNYLATKNLSFMWRTLMYPVELLSAGPVTHFGQAAFFRQYRFEFRNQIPKTFLATRATNFKLKS